MGIQAKRVALLICILGFVAPIALAQTGGAIRGTVVDQAGAPVDRAKVRTDLADNRPRGSFVRYVETNRDGEFLMDRLDWGKYKVFAMKESSGFPDTAFSFYSNNVFPTVAISSKAPVAHLRIQLAAKAAIITGLALDAKAGTPVNAGFKLIRADSPEEWISVTQLAHYRVLIPSSTKVIVEVSAPGYKTWYYGGSKDLARHAPIYLAPSALKRLDIRLQPKKQR